MHFASSVSFKNLVELFWKFWFCTSLCTSQILNNWLKLQNFAKFWRCYLQSDKQIKISKSAQYNFWYLLAATCMPNFLRRRYIFSQKFAISSDSVISSIFWNYGMQKDREKPISKYTLSRLRLCARHERGWALRGPAVAKYKKYRLGTFSTGRHLYTILYHIVVDGTPYAL